MPELRIVNVPQDLINKLNSLTTQSQYQDRSAFVVAALKDYCLYHDKYFTHCLPDTIRILAEDEVSKRAKSNGDILQYALELMQQFGDILSGEDEPESSEIEDDL
jgi:hypothetical protein